MITPSPTPSPADSKKCTPASRNTTSAIPTIPTAQHGGGKVVVAAGNVLCTSYRHQVTYAVSYGDCSKGKYSRVRIESCPEGHDRECEVWYEKWVEQVYEEEEVVRIVPVTVNTYCPKPSTIIYAGSTVTVLEVATTVVFVTQSRVTSTVTVTRLSTTTDTAVSTLVLGVNDRLTLVERETAYATPGYYPNPPTKPQPQHQPLQQGISPPQTTAQLPQPSTAALGWKPRA
ncbi:unnamed protein product [Tuber aestivum]|uniref:Uncharacterized protein n=1 Tax=Tuber aestivum TaxID=59557 RepID=A0A292PZS3_9PEZI|nr:unnamed protein product [Tuber aestivum]